MEASWFDIHFAEVMWGAVITGFGSLASAVALMYRNQLASMRDERDYLRGRLEEVCPYVVPAEPVET